MIIASGTIICILVKRNLTGEYRPVPSFKTRCSMVQWLQGALLGVKILTSFPPGGRTNGKKSGSIDCRKMGESRLAKKSHIYAVGARCTYISVRWWVELALENIYIYGKDRIALDKNRLDTQSKKLVQRKERVLLPIFQLF